VMSGHEVENQILEVNVSRLRGALAHDCADGWKSSS
jgi:hypothetical protein